mgnify:CR=1 FL=1
MSLVKTSYHPTGTHQVIPGVSITVQPEGEQYTIDDCTGVVKVVRLDAQGGMLTMPQAVWFKVDAAQGVDLVHVVAAIQLWLADWMVTVPGNIGVEQILVKTANSHPTDPSFRRVMLHGHMFTIMPFSLTWGQGPESHPTPQPSNVYYLADRKPKRNKDLK